jgi:hypothetical protein
VLAAFFCLLFFAAAKKSRCRPAQGQREKHESKTRMPANPQANHRNAASQQKKTKKPNPATRAADPVLNLDIG